MRKHEVTIAFWESNGRVHMALQVPDGTPALAESLQAAYALARRGYTKRDLARHKWPSSFAWLTVFKKGARKLLYTYAGR